MRTLQEIGNDLETIRSDFGLLERFIKQTEPYTEKDIIECDKLLTKTKTNLENLTASLKEAYESVLDHTKGLNREARTLNSNKEGILEQLGTMIIVMKDLTTLRDETKEYAQKLYDYTVQLVIHD